MPRHNHSSRTRHSYKSEPEIAQDEARPARKFPIFYVYLIIGGLFLASFSITAVLLFGTPPVKVTTEKSANSLRSEGVTQQTPPASDTAVESSPTDLSASALPANQPFLLRSANADGSDTTAPDLSAASLSNDDIQRKENLAEMEFGTKEYAEAERIYREILPSTPRKPLAVYGIYTCLLLQDRRDAAESFLAAAGLDDQSPALSYCKATKAFMDGDTANARDELTEARRLFPELCSPYDPTLKTLGYIP